MKGCFIHVKVKVGARYVKDVKMKEKNRKRFGNKLARKQLPWARMRSVFIFQEAVDVVQLLKSFTTCHKDRSGKYEQIF